MGGPIIFFILARHLFGYHRPDFISFMPPKTLIFCVCILLDFRAILLHEQSFIDLVMEKLDENRLNNIWRFWWNIFLMMYREIVWDWFLTFPTISNLLVHRLHIEPSEAGFFLCLNTLRTASQKVEHLRKRNFFISSNYFYLFLCFSESWVSTKKKYFTFVKIKKEMK